MNQVARFLLIILPLVFCSFQEKPTKKIGWLKLKNEQDTLQIQEAEYGWGILGVGKLKVTDSDGKKHTYRPKEIDSYFFKYQHFIFIPFYGDGTKNSDLVLMESLIYAPEGISYYQSFGLFEGIPNDYVLTEKFQGFINEQGVADQLKDLLQSCKSYKGETDPMRMEREDMKKYFDLFNASCR